MSADGGASTSRALGPATPGAPPHLLRLGTRGSQLALTQSALVARTLETALATSPATGADHGAKDRGRPLVRLADGTGAAQPPRIDLVTIRTQGDVDRTPLSDLGGIGVFAAELRRALLEGEVELAVHSFKDLPTQAVPGLTVACVPPREDPRDALCSRDGLRLAELPQAARVGTGSPRRAAQLLALRPDLRIVDLRGNVPTRLARVRGREDVTAPAGPGDLDAVVLAVSGLRRLGLADHATEVLDPAVMLPAPAQGALAVETRGNVETALPRLARAAAAVEDRATRLAVTAERALMRHLGAGCAAPVGALAEIVPAPHAGPGPGSHTDAAAAVLDGPDVDADRGEGEQHLLLRAVVASLDGSRFLRRQASRPADRITLEEAEALGVAVAEALLADGAEDVVDLHANQPRRG